MGSLVLDFLLVIIFLMMIPIGFYRGGLRELCTSGGLLLGILMAQSWASDWAGVYSRLFGMSEGAAEFLMGVTILFVVTAMVGYGGSAAFSYHPGPGGRLYGAFLALFNAMVLAGFMINLYGTTIVLDSGAEPVTDGIIARTLSQDFGTVLLIATLAVGCSTIFGMFVRDRTEETGVYPSVSQQSYKPTQTRPYAVEVSETSAAAQSGPVRIKDVQEWQSNAESPRVDPATYGSGWRQTWPDATPAQQRNTRSAGRSSRSQPDTPEEIPEDSSRRVLADWMKDQDEV